MKSGLWVPCLSHDGDSWEVYGSVVLWNRHPVLVIIVYIYIRDRTIGNLKATKFSYFYLLTMSQKNVASMSREGSIDRYKH
jgi:hypothetical protein